MNLPICGHPANKLLPFFLNGSLEGVEAESVREHVDGCARCERDLDALSDVAAVIRHRKLPILDAGAVEGRGAAGWFAPAPRLAIAAAILLPILTGVLAYRAGASREAARHRDGVEAAAGEGSSSPAAPPAAAPAPVRVAAAIDLGGGATRGTSTVPRLILARSMDLVSIRFVTPVAPNADHTLELRDPTGASILSQRVDLVLDPLGSATFVLPSDLFVSSGRYSLVVREEAGTGPGRSFEYQFLVERAADDPARR
jgi:hypothetical protein